MELWLIRHAIAVERGSGDDAARPLTPRGRERFSEAVRGLARLGVRFDRLYASPLLRAAETAAMLAPLLRGARVDTPLLAAAPGRALLAALRGNCVALVGHQPHLAVLAAWLVAGERGAGERIELKKGGAAWLEGMPRPAGMTLRALLPPRILRTLGG